MAVGTYAINWSDTQVGKDIVFPSLLGYMIEHTDIPSGVGATGSLKWPPYLPSNANVFVTLTLTLALEGTVAFQWRADGETGYDGGRFYIDGVQQGTCLGTTAWASASFSVASGTHTFKWAYTSDGSYSYGQETLWLAMLSITNVQDPPPVTASTLTPAFYDMEDGAIPALVSGTWINSTSSPITGSRSLRSPLTTADSGTYDAVWTLPALPENGAFVFKWKHDAESYDRFYVLADATVVYTSNDAVVDGTLSLVLPAGTTAVITHRYATDNSYTQGQNASWVDDVSVPFQVSASVSPPSRHATIVASQAAQRASRW